jgi:hypothetical protein
VGDFDKHTTTLAEPANKVKVVETPTNVPLQESQCRARKSLIPLMQSGIRDVQLSNSGAPKISQRIAAYS